MAISPLAPCSDIIFFHTIIDRWLAFSLDRRLGEFAAMRTPLFMFSTLTNFLILVYIFRLFKGSGSGLGRRAVGGRFRRKGEFLPLWNPKTTIKPRFPNPWVWKTCRKTTHFASSKPRSRGAKCRDFIALRSVFHAGCLKNTVFLIRKFSFYPFLYRC